MVETRKPAELASRRASKSGVVSQATPNEIAHSVPSVQAKIPPRAVLARRWPKLRVNRFTGRWLDEKTGRRGEDLTSLSRYLEEARR